MPPSITSTPEEEVPSRLPNEPQQEPTSLTDVNDQQEQQAQHQPYATNNNTQENARSDHSSQDNPEAYHPTISSHSLSHHNYTNTNTTNSNPFWYRNVALSQSAPICFRFWIPTLCLATHLLFYYGQTAPMWKLRSYIDVDVWANATTFLTKQTMTEMGLEVNHHIHYDQVEHEIQTFTYAYAIQHLWEAKGFGEALGLFLPRLAAVLLIVFSGIWPHVKLLCLQVTWFGWTTKQNNSSSCSSTRSKTLQWLGTLGKWSLADVLVVCVMVGVLHLDWTVDPQAIQQGVIDDLPALLELVHTYYDPDDNSGLGLCNTLLKVDCTKTSLKCKACQTLVSSAYNHPGWAKNSGKSLLEGIDTSGGGEANLRVVGMSGIYAFGAAVILSILLSVIVEALDHWAACRNREQDEDRQGIVVLRGPPQCLFSSHNAFLPSRPEQDSSSLQEPLLESSAGGGMGGATTPLEVDSGRDTSFDNHESRYRPKRILGWKYHLWLVLTTFLTVWSVSWNTMERKVSGAGPSLMQDILGMNWQSKYSLRSLMWTTGAAGGWDYMLMGTFGLFLVMGPVVRVALLWIATLLDRCGCSPALLRPVAATANFMGAFCAWEVFLIAIVMVEMLMPSITNTIVHNELCNVISEDGSCLQVEFNILPWTFSTEIISGILLLFLSTTLQRRSLASWKDYKNWNSSTHAANDDYHQLNGEENDLYLDVDQL